MGYCQKSLTGCPNEPYDLWEDNSELMFERKFKAEVQDWALDDLKLTCKECGVSSEDVEIRLFPHAGGCDRFNLCPECYAKREARS